MDPPQISYVDYNSILIINPKGKMRQLFVPFRVQVIQDTTILKRNTWVFVEEVHASRSTQNALQGYIPLVAIPLVPHTSEFLDISPLHQVAGFYLTSPGFLTHIQMEQEPVYNFI